MPYKSPVIANLEVERGDSGNWEFTCYLDDAEIDLADYEVIFSVKESEYLPDASALFDKRKSNSAITVDATDSNKCFVFLTPTETRSMKPDHEYRYWLRLIRSSDGLTGTPVRGSLIARRGGVAS